MAKVLTYEHLNVARPALEKKESPKQPPAGPCRPRKTPRVGSELETRRALPRTMGPSECEPEMTTQNESLDRELS